jgi:hypothetical protein
MHSAAAPLEQRSNARRSAKTISEDDQRGRSARTISEDDQQRGSAKSDQAQPDNTKEKTR